jgi:hypothetical protein
MDRQASRAVSACGELSECSENTLTSIYWQRWVGEGNDDRMATMRADDESHPPPETSRRCLDPCGRGPAMGVVRALAGQLGCSELVVRQSNARPDRIVHGQLMRTEGYAESYSRMARPHASTVASHRPHHRDDLAAARRNPSFVARIRRPHPRERDDRRRRDVRCDSSQR